MERSNCKVRHYIPLCFCAALLFLMLMLFHFPAFASSALSANPRIMISRTDAIMVKGQKLDLFLYDKNRIADDEENEGAVLPVPGVRWKSSNKKVASVKGNGTVKAKKAGKVTITGTYAGKTYRCKIKVYKSLSSSKREKLAKKEAKRIVKKYLKPSMSPQVKALVLASYLLVNVDNQHDQSNKRYKKNYGNEAYAALIMHLAACSGHCRAYVMLCKAAGLKCKHVNAGKWTHQWNEVKLGGKWVLVDTQAGFFSYSFTEDEFERYSALAYDYNHIGPVYLKHIRGIRQ